MARRLALPLAEETARELRAGDEVLLSGRIITARDLAHERLANRDHPRIRAVARGSAVYHCAPVAVRDRRSGAWRFVAAGPSRSIGAEPYEPLVIARYGLRAVLGKGGMGPGTQAALVRFGAVYLHAPGALAVALARHVKRVVGVRHLAELGVAEAIWIVDVEGFPAVVTMDSHGDSLHVLAAGGDRRSAPGSAASSR